MRASLPFVRLLKAAGLLAVALVCATPAEAARGASRSRAAVCDPATTTLRQIARHSKSSAGPLARVRRLPAGLSDPAVRLSRAAHPDDRDDDEAIQNDAPAARIDADERALPILRPIGLLVRAVDARPGTLAGSPKSPRGPPVSA